MRTVAAAPAAPPTPRAMPFKGLWSRSSLRVARRRRLDRSCSRRHDSSARGGSSVAPRLAVGDRQAARADPAALEPSLIEPRDLHAVAGRARVHKPAIDDIYAAAIETVQEHDPARREPLTYHRRHEPVRLR